MATRLRTPEARQRWRREHKRERLEGYPHVWVQDVDETGRPCWTLTVTTENHTYVCAGADQPRQYGNEATYVQVTWPVADFLASEAA